MMRGLTAQEIALLDLVDSDEPMLEGFTAEEEATAQALLRRGLMVRAEPWAPPGLGDDVTALGRAIAALCRDTLRG